MYARVLCVGGAFGEQTEFCGRIFEILRNAGHGVRACLLPGEASAAREELLAACRTFRPTLVLWNADGDTSEADCEVLRGLPCCKVALAETEASLERFSGANGFDFIVGVSSTAGANDGIGEGALVLTCGIDTSYRKASLSQPSAERKGVLCSQSFSPDRSRALRESAERAGVAVAPSINGTWPDALQKRLPGACLAHFARKARYAAFFDGDDISCGEVALRIAEGSVVLVEERAAAKPSMASFASSVIPFAEGRLSEALGELEGSEELCQRAIDAQRQALDAEVPLEEGMSKLLLLLDCRCRERSMAPVLAYEGAAVRIVLFGWFGAQNFGDDLLMRLTATRIEERYPNAQISIIGADPSVIRKDYGYEAVEPHEKYRIRDLLQDARALVYCGGLLFDDPMADTAGELEFMFDPWIELTGQASVALLAASHGVRPVLLGIGAGPLSNDATQKAVRLIAMANALFLPRDIHTEELLLAAGVPAENIRVKADLVFDAKTFVDDASSALPEVLCERAYFVVSLRQWHLNPCGFEREIALAVGRIFDETGLAAVFVPFDKDDASIHRCVWEQLSGEAKEHAVVFEERPDEGQLLALMKGSSFALAMRLHCSILHHILGKPSVGLDYNDKIGAHFELVGQRDLLCDLDSSAEVVTEKALRAARGACGLENLAACVASRARLAEEAFEELFEIIDSWRPDVRGREVYFPRTIAYAKQQLALSRRRTAEAEKALREERKKAMGLTEKLKKAESAATSPRPSLATKVARKARGAKRRAVRLLKRP